MSIKGRRSLRKLFAAVKRRNMKRKLNMPAPWWHAPLRPNNRARNVGWRRWIKETYGVED